MTDLFIGLMSGTSMDAIDAALADFSQPAPVLVRAINIPLDSALREECLALGSGCADNAMERLAVLDQSLGNAFANAVSDLLQRSGLQARAIRAIGSHGQTLWHQPDSPHPFTLQLGNPNQIAENTGITTVADFRRRDMAAGGQGAPLAPAFHNAVFRSPDENRVILNIGGMANITILPAEPHARVTGFDTGPGNVLLDGWHLIHRRQRFDRNGAWAATGSVNQPLLDKLMADAYFQAPPPKSTGRERFNLEWLQTQLSAANTAASPQDIQATLCELTAGSIADAVLKHAPATQRVLVCGGGTHNSDLMTRLRQRLSPRPLETTDAAGIAPDWVEALAFAWLAKQTLEGKAGNLPSVTGAKKAVVLGGIYQAGDTTQDER
jgi:anhydro-N-acetylmuramic acid kinase